MIIWSAFCGFYPELHYKALQSVLCSPDVLADHEVIMAISKIADGEQVDLAEIVA